MSVQCEIVCENLISLHRCKKILRGKYVCVHMLLRTHATAYIQQSLAKYSGLRMTQTVYGCGLALRVVCVNFLNTCPIAP